MTFLLFRWIKSFYFYYIKNCAFVKKTFFTQNLKLGKQKQRSNHQKTTIEIQILKRVSPQTCNFAFKPSLAKFKLKIQ